MPVSARGRRLRAQGRLGASAGLRHRHRPTCSGTRPCSACATGSGWRRCSGLLGGPVARRRCSLPPGLAWARCARGCAGPCAWCGGCAAWARLHAEAAPLRAELADRLQSLTQAAFVGEARRRLERVRRRRLRLRERARERDAEREAEAARAAEREQEIDRWRVKCVQEVEEKKREQELKVAADGVLSEVRKKQADTKRMVDILRALEKLRKLRKEAAARKDEFPLAHLLQPFRQYYLQAEHSLPALIQIRHDWDQYLVPSNHPKGNSVPQGWVLPPLPSNDIWATAIKLQ